MPAATAAVSFQLERLNSLTAALFGGLTYRALQHVLMQVSGHGPVAGIGAFVKGKPAGLILGEVSKGSGTILSVVVDKASRNEGIAAALVGAMESELATRGASSVEIVFRNESPARPALARVLGKRGWPAPSPKHLICRSDRRMAEAPWMSLDYLPPEYEVFPWKDLRAEERAKLMELERSGGWFPESLSPLVYEVSMEPETSRGLRYRGEVVAWVITQLRGRDTLCYACSYIHPDLQASGRLMAVYARAVRRQMELGNTEYGVWIVPFIHAPMTNFVLKRMRPWLTSLEEFHASRKDLIPGISQTGLSHSGEAA